MTRNGKIARLPKHIRHDLNTRLDDGQLGKDLIQWLNSLDEVKKLISTDFHGHPVSEQNLSEWKNGGFREWQRQEQTFEQVRALIELSDELDPGDDEQSIADRLAVVLAAELAAETQKLLQETNDPTERFRYIRETLQQLYTLRVADQTAVRLRMAMERWQIECQEREWEESRNLLKEASQYVTEPLRAADKRAVLVKAYGGGEAGEKAADFILEIERRYQLRRFPSPDPVHPSPVPPPPNQTPIAPDQTKSN